MSKWTGIPRRDGRWLRVGRWWYHPVFGRVPVIAGGANVFAITQRAFRFYNDDGSETTATAIDAENANIARDAATVDKNVVLRIGLQESGAGSISGATTDDYQLQYSKNGGAFTNITAATTNVKGFNSSNLTDAGTTTQRLSAGSGSFVAGEISEVGLVTDRQLTANNFTEMLYTLTLVAADLADGDTLDFRVLLNGATTNVTYSVTPRITVGAPSFTQTRARWRRDDGSETTATWIAAEDVDISWPYDMNLRLRIQVDETGGIVGDTWPDTSLWYSLNGGAYTESTNASSVARAVTSPNVTDGTATTAQLTAPTGTFQAATVDSDGTPGSEVFTAGQYTEWEFVLQLRGGDVKVGDTIDFRVRRDAGGSATALAAYTKTPRVTIALPVMFENYKGVAAVSAGVISVTGHIR